MASTAEKQQPLWFSRELFAAYWTALNSRVRQDENCDKVYSDIMPHPLIALQNQNHKQILDYKCVLVVQALPASTQSDRVSRKIDHGRPKCIDTA